ncbi:hypothetical protein DL93DRAFT_2029872, partial [Clavulina sp. PMI_390]
LPEGITIDRVYADFLDYLLAQTRRHLRDYFGADPWPSWKARAEILLTHPNGWGDIQQGFLRQVVAQAGIMTLEDTQSRLHFAEEGE